MSLTAIIKATAANSLSPPAEGAERENYFAGRFPGAGAGARPLPAAGPPGGRQNEECRETGLVREFSQFSRTCFGRDIALRCPRRYSRRKLAPARGADGAARRPYPITAEGATRRPYQLTLPIKFMIAAVIDRRYICGGGARKVYRPIGNCGDSSQSARRFSSNPVNPMVDLRLNESWFGPV